MIIKVSKIGYGYNVKADDDSFGLATDEQGMAEYIKEHTLKAILNGEDVKIIRDFADDKSIDDIWKTYEQDMR